jgi:hypothetical protein
VELVQQHPVIVCYQTVVMPLLPSVVLMVIVSLLQQHVLRLILLAIQLPALMALLLQIQPIAQV